MILFGKDGFWSYFLFVQFHFLVSNSASEILSNSSWCRPVSPSISKEHALAKFRDNYSVPLMFWHLQKAGGTTLCLTFLQSYEQILDRSDLSGLYPGWDNCNEPIMSAEIMLHPDNTYMDKYRPKGKYFMAIEPSHSYRRKKTDPPIDPNDFPFKYREKAWNAAVHVIAVRHPFELAVSALHYVFQPDRFTMLG